MTTKVEQQPTTTRRKPEPLLEPIPVIVQPESAPGNSWLTLETLLYVTIVMLGLALRLWELDSYPLSDIEAQHSLAAFQLYQGETIESATAYSPLLVSLGTLIFSIFDASDVTARLVTILLGTVLILLPVTLRRQLGRPICLLASILLAASPIALFLSRTLNSEIGVATGALMVICGFFNWAEEGERRWLFLLATGLAFMLTTGPMAYLMLVIFTFIVLIKRSNFKALWQQGLMRSAGHKSQTEQATKSEDDEDVSDFSGNGGPLTPQLRQTGIFFLVALFLLATAFTLNLSGFSLTTSLFTEWLGRFSFQPRLDGSFNAVFLLTIYEILLVIAGLVGLAYVMLSGNLLRLVFAGWFIGALILDLAMAGRPMGSVILSLVPLAFLAAMALAELWTGLQTQGSWSNEGIILASGLVIAIFSYIWLTQWLVRTCSPDDFYCNLAWLQSVAALLLFGVIVLFFWFVYGHSTALRGLALTGLVLGLIITISMVWRLNYGPLMNLAYQPLAAGPASTKLISLSNTLFSESLIRAGDKTLLDVAVIQPTPALQWRLRKFDNLILASSIAELQAPSAIITPATTNNEQELSLENGYIGQDFAINAFWSPVGLQTKDLINWFIYRKLNQPPQSSSVILWLRVD